jgi:hypothetical protein
VKSGDDLAILPGNNPNFYVTPLTLLMLAVSHPNCDWLLWQRASFD